MAPGIILIFAADTEFFGYCFFCRSHVGSSSLPEVPPFFLSNLCCTDPPADALHFLVSRFLCARVIAPF